MCVKSLTLFVSVDNDNNDKTIYKSFINHFFKIIVLLYHRIGVLLQ